MRQKDPIRLVSTELGLMGEQEMRLEGSQKMSVLVGHVKE